MTGKEKEKRPEAESLVSGTMSHVCEGRMKERQTGGIFSGRNPDQRNAGDVWDGRF